MKQIARPTEESNGVAEILTDNKVLMERVEMLL